MWGKTLAFAALFWLSASLCWSEAPEDSPPDFSALAQAITRAELSDRQKQILTPPIEALTQDSRAREARFNDLLLTLTGTQQNSNQLWKLSDQERQEWGTKVLMWQVATAGTSLLAIITTSLILWQAIHR